MLRAEHAEVDDLCALTISELLALFARREVTPLEMARASIQRLESTESELNSFISVDRDQVLAEATRLDKEFRRGQLRGPLHGVPIAVKDNIEACGYPTTAGSTAYVRPDQSHDATAVTRLRAAGALLFGKTNLPEFAYGPVDSYHYGPTRNPWDTDRYAGGSSMGSGAAVAAGVVPGALGTDTTGSIRNPATWCGVVGLKPSYGLVPLRGVTPLATSLDHVGPLARSAEDCARILSVIAGVDPDDPTTEQFPPVDYLDGLDIAVTGLRVGVVHSLWEAVDSTLAATLESALNALRGIGAHLVEVEIGFWDEVVEASETLLACEAAVEYGTLLATAEARLLPEIGRRLRGAASVLAADFILARRISARFRQEYRRTLRDVDLLVWPGHHCTAPRIDAGGRRLDPSKSLRFVVPMNVIGAPAMVTPAGFVDGLPISIQLASLPGNEPILLGVAHAFQQVTGWHRERPPLKPERNGKAR